MQPYKLMIIDDELESRRALYESVYSPQYFDLIPIDSPTHLEKIVNTTPVDGYVVDVFLDEGKWKGIGNAGELFSSLLRTPPRPTPIFLVSRNWGDPDAMAVIMELNRQHNHDIDILRYLAWQEFETAIEGGDESQNTGSPKLTALRNKMLDDLSVWHERSTFRPENPDDSIRILLLADLQYLDPHTSESAVFDELWLGRALNRDGLIPDFIVLAGDIGCTGAPSEYCQARKKLENLVNFMWNNELDKYRERIILVPGNHDMNLRIAAGCRYDWDRDNKKWIEKTSPKMVDNPEPPKPINYNDYALEPFRQFARNITGSRLWDNPRINCRVDRRFELSGLRFYLFNSISNATVDEPKKADFSVAAMERITLELGRDDKPENFFNIAVSHHGVQLGGTPREQMENWDAVGKQYFGEHHIKLWLFGHYHEFDTQEHKLEEGKKLGLLQSHTLKIRTSDAQRGFSLIELVRSEGQVVSVKAYPYTLGKKGVNDKKRPDGVVVWEKKKHSE